MKRSQGADASAIYTTSSKPCSGKCPTPTRLMTWTASLSGSVTFRRSTSIWAVTRSNRKPVKCSTVWDSKMIRLTATWALSPADGKCGLRWHGCSCGCKARICFPFSGPLEQWLKELKHSPKTKSNIKGLLHRIFEYAMKWEILETQRNPMQLVEIKGVTKRVRKKVVLTVEQYQALLAELPYHIQVMVMIAMCLGLRISEIRALRWPDFDLKGRILTLTRSIVGRYVWNGGKTGASEDEVFLDSKLVSVLEDWQKRCVETPEAWLFANADTKRPVHGDAIQKDYLRPAGEKIGLQGVGWHSFRHTYRTLIDDIGTPLGVQQRLMRHADIKTTMNTYGSAFEKTKRRANSRVADLVLPPAIKRQLKDRAKEVSLKNLRPETAAIQ